jgi:NAD-dependent SIR2 family protein deacetylase
VTFKKDDVLILLGAGASVEAGIPHSGAMVSEIERELAGEWAQFEKLYNCVKSAIFYADGIRGKHPTDVAYNIERLVNALEELDRREEHTLYPFVGAWNHRLVQVAGSDFENVSDFRKAILQRLRSQWIAIDNYEKAAYFNGLIRFQKQLNHPLRVFTLNYDLCVEKAYYEEYKEYPERGFERDSSRSWNHELLEDSERESANIYLYKLHGSIDWTRDPDSDRLTFSDSPSKIEAGRGQMIFGTSYKLQYVDPFLFLVYQARRLSLEAKLIVVIGYGFADEHINAILGQALRQQPHKRLIAVTWFGDVSEEHREVRKKTFEKSVKDRLKLSEGDGQLFVQVSPAKRFLAEELTHEAVGRHFPIEEPLFDEVAVQSSATAVGRNKAAE